MLAYHNLCIGLSTTEPSMMCRHLPCSRVYSNSTASTFQTVRRTHQPPRQLLHFPTVPLLTRPLCPCNLAPPTSPRLGKTLGVTSPMPPVPTTRRPLLKTMRQHRRRRFTNKTVACSTHCWNDRATSTDAAMPTSSIAGSCWSRGQR